MRLIKRELLTVLTPWLTKPEIIVITGSRQVGKTTLLKLFNNNIGSENKVYFDLEDHSILDICNAGVENLIQYLRLQGYSIQKKLYVFIDEIQYLKDPSNFLKLIHDHHPTIKLIVTGSSSLDIRKKFTDSLTGRKVVFELDSFNFVEFLHLKHEKLYKIKRNIGNIRTILTGNYNSEIKLLSGTFNDVLQEYIVFGGYPRNLHEEKLDFRSAVLGEIYTSYVRRDIRDIANIADITAFNNLIKLLADQIGGLINYNELSNTLGNNLQTIKNYMFLLENTFIISRCQPYFENKRKEISKMPKNYFCDTGLRNTIINNLSVNRLGSDWGHLYENYIYNELRRHYKPNDHLFYWRTIAGAEVDFIITDEYRKPVPVEVKVSDLKSPKISKSFRSFINTYKPEKGIIFNNSYVDKIKIDHCEVYFLPFFAV